MPLHNLKCGTSSACCTCVTAISFVSLDSRDQNLQAKRLSCLIFGILIIWALAMLYKGSTADLIYSNIAVILLEQSPVMECSHC